MQTFQTQVNISLNMYMYNLMDVWLAASIINSLHETSHFLTHPSSHLLNIETFVGQHCLVWSLFL